MKVKRGKRYGRRATMEKHLARQDCVQPTLEGVPNRLLPSVGVHGAASGGSTVREEEGED